MKSSQGEENTDPQKENKAPNVSRNVATSSKVNTQMRSDIAMPSGKYDSSSKSTPRSDFVDNEEETEHPPQLPLKSAKTRNMQEAIARERAQPAAAEIAPENDEADNENDIEEELFEGLYYEAIFAVFQSVMLVLKSFSFAMKYCISIL